MKSAIARYFSTSHSEIYGLIHIFFRVNFYFIFNHEECVYNDISMDS